MFMCCDGTQSYLMSDSDNPFGRTIISLVPFANLLPITYRRVHEFIPRAIVVSLVGSRSSSLNISSSLTRHYSNRFWLICSCSTSISLSQWLCPSPPVLSLPCPYPSHECRGFSLLLLVIPISVSFLAYMDLYSTISLSSATLWVLRWRATMKSVW